MKKPKPGSSKFKRDFEELGLCFNNVGLGLGLEKLNPSPEITNPNSNSWLEI